MAKNENYVQNIVDVKCTQKSKRISEIMQGVLVSSSKKRKVPNYYIKESYKFTMYHGFSTNYYNTDYKATKVKILIYNKFVTYFTSWHKI
jgi:uncharacterized membrane protein YoaT (DUF817 family)